jgi:hypothetical protein
MSDPFAPLGGDAPKQTKKKDDGWRCLTPVPDDAPAPPEAHPSLGKPTGRWFYSDAEGRLLGLANRFDATDGSKQFRPLTLWERERDHRREWRWEAWPVPRPLYHLADLAERPKAPVLVVEGEKAADAAGRLLPDFVVVTSPNGSKSASKADWSPLAGRRVVAWGDADDPGAAYAEDVARLAREVGAASVAVLAPPEGVAEGWDAADAEVKGWTTARTEALVASARSASVIDLEAARREKRATGAGAKKKSGGGSDDGEGGGRRRRPAQRDQLAGLCNDIELWHDEAGDCFATIPVAGHRENWSLAAKTFRRWLSARSYEQTGLAPGGQALEDTIRVLEARAWTGPERVPCLRVGEADGRAYLDLVDAVWRAVEIDGNGWRIVDRSPVAFVRSGQIRPLPEPEPGYGVEELRRFVNVERDEDFALLVAWLVAALRADGPYPILTFAGEQGTGKSTLSRLVRSLVDPNAAPIRAVPKDDRDLVVGAVNSHVIALDNLSSVPSWLSDALCRLATGGGFASRMLHTDREESVMQAVRPIILNGIPSLTDRPDLASRAVTVRLRPIAETERRTEAEFWSDWSTTAPRVLGALLDGFSTGLRRLPSVKLDRLPRMADFARFATACEPGLGFEPGSFMAAYAANLADTTETTFEADPVAVAIRDMILADYPTGWNGSATELLAVLNLRTAENTKKLKLWPATASSLGNRVDRIAPVLRSQGFSVDRRHSGTRTITIAPKSNA